MSHSATPWKAEGFGVWAQEKGENRQVAFTGKDNGEGVYKVKTDQEAVDNAAHIVRAVNAHEDLVSFVIQYLYSEHGICHPEDEAAPYSPEELKKMAQDLISNIKGR
jgi:hypothetical protein